MKVLGITGGVGAGKSTILSYLSKKYSAKVILADEVGKQLQQPGEEGFLRIVEVFGSAVLLPDGSLDRAALAETVFTDKEKLEQLNAIIHPAVKKRITQQLACERQKKKAPFCVIEAALLLEDGYDQICDEIWYIYTDPMIRMKRLAESRGYSEKKTRQIMSNQPDDGIYRKKCKFVIDNSSDIVENTYEQIDKGLREHGFL